MPKRFRSYDLNQIYLLPPSLQEWLPEGHLARFIAGVTAELDISAIESRYERADSRGKAAYHPLMLLRPTRFDPARDPVWFEGSVLTGLGHFEPFRLRNPPARGRVAPRPSERPVTAARPKSRKP
jgi:hypothetical protein